MADGFQNSPDLAPEAITRRSFSVAELDAMFKAQILSRDEKIELIDGDIIKMNSQMMRHGVIKMRILKALLAQLPVGLDASNGFSVQLGESTLIEPDIIVSPTLEAELRYVRDDEVLLAIEVAHTSLKYDLGAKANLYSRVGIKELWVVDVNSQQTWVHRDPSSEGYKSIVGVPFQSPLIALFDINTKIVIGSL